MVQPAAAAQAGMAAALNDHDRMRRSTDIPLFYARRDKDTVLPRILIDRIEDAAAIATWDEARKIRELKLCLRERAIGGAGFHRSGISPKRHFTEVAFHRMPL